MSGYAVQPNGKVRRYWPERLLREKVFMLWFDHGESPQGASYRYIVVPNVTVSELDKASSANHNVKILTNTSEIQAAEDAKQGICQVVFYRAGEIGLSNGVRVRTASQGMAILRMNEKRIQTLSVSDPSRKSKKITLTVSGIYEARGDGFHTVSDRSKHSTEIVVDLPQGVYAGKSVTIEL